MRRPRYFLLALGIAFLTAQLLFWFNNIHLLFYMTFQAPVPLTQKLLFPFQSFSDLTAGFTLLQAVTVLLLAILEGILLTMLTYILRRRALNTSGLLAGGGSLIVAVFGLGCPACGTSLLSPLLTTLVAGSAAMVGAVIAPIINIISILLALYALFVLGQQLANERAKEQQANESENQTRIRS